MTLKMALCTQDDLSEAIKLQKREQYEEERKKRIFNAKQRLFGVSIDIKNKKEKSRIAIYITLPLARFRYAGATDKGKEEAGE